MVVVAAGNRGKDAASNLLTTIPGVVTVGALAPNGKKARYSNEGKTVDLFAPAGFQAPKAGGGYARFGGTSASAALVSGMVALVLSENPELNVSQVVERLKP